MKFALVTDTFPPLRNSGAVQLRDLAEEFVRQGYDLTVFLPSSEISNAYTIEDFHGAKVCRLKAIKTKDVGYVKRTLAEFLMPFLMKHNFKKTGIKNEWDGVIWYSPSIFHAPFVSFLKGEKVKSYLIIRDIFPEWALDMGLMRRGPAYFFFKLVASYQYKVANFIGVQTPGNLGYFDKKKNKKVEVLQNWLADKKSNFCSIDVSKTKIQGRRIFVYAGNMGVAQGMGVILRLVESLKYRKDIGFIFVGRGSESSIFSKKSKELENLVFFDEIDPDEVPGLYAQCDVGLVALDAKHKSHNIPGKFISYMQAGLPVLANINQGNDLVKIISQEGVGYACDDGSFEKLESFAIKIIEDIGSGVSYSSRCFHLYEKSFTPSSIVNQISDNFKV